MRGKDHLKRASFLITLGIIWVLWEQGRVESILKFAGLVLLVYGFSVVVIEAADLQISGSSRRPGS